MIDEKETLRRFLKDVIQLKIVLENATVEADLKTVQGVLTWILEQTRDNPVRCEGGGSMRMPNNPGYSMPAYITILPTPTQAEQDAEQEAAWRKMFEP